MADCGSTVSVALIQVSKDTLDDFILDEVCKVFEPISSILDKFCSKYEVDSPWKDDYALNGKYYLYRVSIGSIGRIKTVRQSAFLGIHYSGQASYHHFCCGAFYHIFRYARALKRAFKYVISTEKWTNDMLSGRTPNSRFMELFDMGKEGVVNG